MEKLTLDPSFQDIHFELNSLENHNSNCYQEFPSLYYNPQKFKFLPELLPFTLPKLSTLSIFCKSEDAWSTLKENGLLNRLESYGIAFSRSAIVSDSNVVIDLQKLSFLSSESFEIQVRPEKIILIASDLLGMQYGLIALKLVFCSISTFSEQNFQIPSLVLYDSPRIAQRAVVWSFQNHFLLPKFRLQQYLTTISLLKFNTIFLNFDKLFDVSENSEEGNVNDYGKIFNEISDSCLTYNIELIPTLTIDSRSQISGNSSQLLDFMKGLPIEKLLLVYKLEYSQEKLLNDSTQKSNFSLILSLLNEIPSLKAISFSLNEFALELFAEELENLTIPFTVYDYEELFPSAFQQKPIVLLKDYVDGIWQHISDALLDGKKVVCFPLSNEVDFLSPQLPILFLLGIFGYISAHGERYLSIYEQTSFEKFVAELVSIILPSEEEKSWKNCSKLFVQLFNYKNQQNNGILSMSGNDLAPSARTEQLLYSLYLMVDNLQFSDLPSREESLSLFRMYRNILHQFNYSLQNSRKKRNHNHTRAVLQQDTFSMVDDYLSLLNTLSMLSRAVYVATVKYLDDESTALASGYGANPAGNFGDLNQMQQKRAAVYDNVDMSKRREIKSHPKTEKISKLLINVVQQNILFRNFKSEEHHKIVDAFEFMNAKAGEIVIKQGDSGEYFYIVESGKLDVFMESCGLRIKVGRTLGEGDYFGELALMYNTPRAATVISTEPSNLWRIDRQTYRTIVTYHNKAVSDEFFGLVSNVHILGKKLGDVLSHAELNKVVSTLEIEEFENDSVIIRQHQTGDYFYIISEGQVDVWQETTTPTGRNHMGTKLATLKRGDCFGEKALLADDVRQATCIAVGKVVCLSLSRDDFISMIGSWQDITNVDHLQTFGSKKAKIRESVYDSQYHITLHLDDIEQLNTLGVGAFGRVRVARHKSTAQLYALKVQSKAFIVSQNMQDMILNEMHIMKQIDHPFISKLHASIQDKKYIYFLLELLPGGEFFTFLQSAGKLTEDKSRFYSASVVLALEELHKYKIAYRDLKPENMVMDGRGYVKLVDFGLAKQIVSGSTWTMCGTPDYLAPEIILNKGHNYAVDYWALGVLIFEMLHGWPPFYHDQPMKVYEKIILGKVDYPSSFSKALEDIITKFLVTNPSKRLGNMKGGFADVFKHKWYGSFDWQALLAGSLSAPYIPDLTAFDSAVAAGADDDEEEEEPEDSDWDPPLV